MSCFSRRSAVRLLSAVSCVLLSGPLLGAPNKPASPPDFSKFLIYAPYPKWPTVAGMEGAHGDGIFLLLVRISSGRVEEVMVAKSTGRTYMDSEATEAFMQWRFKPGALPPISKFLKKAPKTSNWSSDEYSVVKVPVIFRRASWKLWPM